MNWRSPDYIVEEKHDGIRCIATIHGGRAMATGRRWASPGILAELKGADAVTGTAWHPQLEGCILDGELMADGTFWIFDLLRHGTQSLLTAPLRERKRLLETLGEFLPPNASLVRSCASVGELGAFGEGVVWKRLGAKYGFDWFKAKRVVTVDLRVLRVLGEGVAEVDGRGKIVGVPAGVRPGQLVEAEAFAVFPSGKLRNGRFVRTRFDK